MVTRVFLFLATNLSVIVVLSIFSWVFGIDEMMGGSTMGLLVMAAVIGFAGSFISLAMSKSMAKRGMGVQVIDNPSNERESWLVRTVERQAREAGIGMPEVGIFPSPQPNAFATGMNRNNSLVAVSAGLLEGMTQDEVEAVLGHEVSHVANGDMVTMGLLQGVLNTFVIFFSRIIGRIVDQAVFKNSRGYGPGYFIVSMIAQVVLGVLASIIAAWFSRKREFRADEGGARLSSRDKMAGALRRLQNAHNPEDLPGQLAAFGISGGVGGGLRKLMMSHPPLEERIAALMEMQ
ncbi:MAG: protease HtpX [Gammaproteobacteria bacterium]